MTDDPLARVFRGQAQICASFGSPFYAALAGRAADGLDEMRGLFAPWDGQSFEELMGAAVSLRFLGPDVVYDGRPRDEKGAQAGNDAALSGMYAGLKDGDPFRTGVLAKV